MGVTAEREHGAAAHIAIVAVADLDHHVAENRLGNPRDHPLKQVVVIELAGHPVLADVEAYDLQRPVLPTVIAVLDRRVFGLLGGLDESMRAQRDQQLPIVGERRLRIGLALRVQVPGKVAAGKVCGAHLALERNEAAATRGVVALNADMLLFEGFAGVVDGRGITLEVRSRPVRALARGGETLTHRAHPARAGIDDGIYGAGAYRLVGG